MFDFSMGEIALFIAVALIFIGPKELPVVLRTLSKAIKTVRSLAHEFQQHIDDMVKEVDLSDAQKDFQTLKNFSLRKQVTRIIDPKRELEHSLKEEKILDTPYDGLPRVPPPPPPPSFDLEEGNNRADVPYNARLAEQKKALENAPSFLPPQTAIRLIEEAPYWRRPYFLPPEVALHYGKRVPIIKSDDGTMKKSYDHAK